jgi:hypothetical protein
VKGGLWRLYICDSIQVEDGVYDQASPLKVAHGRRPLAEGVGGGGSEEHPRGPPAVKVRWSYTNI